MKLLINNIPLTSSTPTADLSSLRVFWASQSNVDYTLGIFDLDAPYPQNPSMSPYIHLLIANILNNDIINGMRYFDYVPPNPPLDSKPHRYIVNIYAQKYLLPNINFVSRSNFPVDSLVQQYELTLVESETFFVDPQSKTTYVGSLPLAPPKHHQPFIKSDTTLNERQAKYCDCVIDLAVKQPGLCNLEKAWFQTRDSKQCINPFAVCAKSTGGSNRQCSENYDYASMTDDQLIAYCHLHSVAVPEPFRRQDMISYLVSKNH